MFAKVYQESVLCVFSFLLNVLCLLATSWKRCFVNLSGRSASPVVQAVARHVDIPGSSRDMGTDCVPLVCSLPPMQTDFIARPFQLILTALLYFQTKQRTCLLTQSIPQADRVSILLIRYFTVSTPVRITPSNLCYAGLKRQRYGSVVRLFDFVDSHCI